MNMNVNSVNPSFGVRVSTRKLVAGQITAPLVTGKHNYYLAKLANSNIPYPYMPSEYFSALLKNQYPEIAQKCAVANKNLQKVLPGYPCWNFNEDYVNNVAKSIVKDNNLPRTLDIKMPDKNEAKPLMDKWFAELSMEQPDVADVISERFERYESYKSKLRLNDEARKRMNDKLIELICKLDKMDEFMRADFSSKLGKRL